MQENDNNPLSTSHEEAFRNVLAHRTMLKAYVLAIVKNPVLAEDVLQDISIQIAKSWDRYDKSKPFPLWARGVARRIACDHIRKEGKQPRLLDEDVLEAVGTHIDSMGTEDDLEERKSILEKCMEALSDTSRNLLRLRYFEGRPFKEIADLVKRGKPALYTAFSRIHTALTKCAQKALGDAA